MREVVRLLQVPQLAKVQKADQMEAVQAEEEDRVEVDQMERDRMEEAQMVENQMVEAQMEESQMEEVQMEEVHQGEEIRMVDRPVVRMVVIVANMEVVAKADRVASMEAATKADTEVVVNTGRTMAATAESTERTVRTATAMNITVVKRARIKRTMVAKTRAIVRTAVAVLVPQAQRMPQARRQTAAAKATVDMAATAAIMANRVTAARVASMATAAAAARETTEIVSVCNAFVITLFSVPPVADPASKFSPGPVAAGAAAACFDAHTIVQSRHYGAIEMQHVHVGDEVLAYNAIAQCAVYSPVRFFLHREHATASSMLRLRTGDNRTITLSEWHMLPLVDCHAMNLAHDEGERVACRLRSHCAVAVVALTPGVTSHLTQTAQLFASRARAGQHCVITAVNQTQMVFRLCFSRITCLLCSWCQLCPWSVLAERASTHQ